MSRFCIDPSHAVYVKMAFGLIWYSFVSHFLRRFDCLEYWRWSLFLGTSEYTCRQFLSQFLCEFVEFERARLKSLVTSAPLERPWQHVNTHVIPHILNDGNPVIQLPRTSRGVMGGLLKGSLALGEALGLYPRFCPFHWDYLWGYVWVR